MLHRIKSFAFVILGFFIVITLFSLLMPSTAVVVRSETIPSTRADILKQIQQPEAWLNWYPPLKDTSTVPSVQGDTIRWNSSNHKNILFIEKKHREGIRASFTRSGELPVLYDITVYEIDGLPQVEWKAIHKLPWYPWEKFAGIFLDDLAGQGYAIALVQLKEWVQSGKE